MAVASRFIRAYGMGMTLLADNTAILIKTQELCAAIAGDPAFMQYQARIETFLDDDDARMQYTELSVRPQRSQ